MWNKSPWEVDPVTPPPKEGNHGLGSTSLFLRLHCHAPSSSSGSSVWYFWLKKGEDKCCPSSGLRWSAVLTWISISTLRDRKRSDPTGKCRPGGGQFEKCLYFVKPDVDGLHDYASVCGDCGNGVQRSDQNLESSGPRPWDGDDPAHPWRPCPVPSGRCSKHICVPSGGLLGKSWPTIRLCDILIITIKKILIPFSKALHD